MIESNRDYYDPDASTVILTGVTGRTHYEVTILTRDLDQLAELAARNHGRTAHAGPVRVQVLSPASAGAK